MKNSDNLVLGIIAGAAAGAILGMLFSPHSGTVNRRIIRRKGEDIAFDVTEAIAEPIEQLYDTITDKIEMLKKQALSGIGR